MLAKNNKVVDVLERTLKQIVVHVKKVKETILFLPIKPFRLQIEVVNTEPFFRW